VFLFTFSLTLYFLGAAILDQEYDPFGKPGAGAPIRTDSGTVLTSYHSRQVSLFNIGTQAKKFIKLIEFLVNVTYT